MYPTFSTLSLQGNHPPLFPSEGEGWGEGFSREAAPHPDFGHFGHLLPLSVGRRVRVTPTFLRSYFVWDSIARQVNVPYDSASRRTGSSASA